jgi:hypothetical protein
MSAWKSLPENIPVDGSTVWVRVNYYYSDPFLAVFSLSALTFTSVDNTIIYPVWVISRWRVQ